MKYFIRITYDGSKFFGFQRLQDCPTVQKSLEDALSCIDGEQVLVKGAGRTDRGVHAKGQGVHFSLQHSIPVKGLQHVLNRYLAPYIQVLECREVTDSFHARFSAQQKRYRYRICLGDYDPCLYDYVLFLKDLDVERMKEVGKLFVGVHNFQNFVSGTRENYEAVLFDILFEQREQFLDIIFVGKSFYRYMVRNLVGALLDIGMGKRDIMEVKEALSDQSLKKRFSTAPSNGLYLEDVVYSSEYFLD